MSDVDAEDLIARLSGGLSPTDRAAFRRGAESAVASSPVGRGLDLSRDRKALAPVLPSAARHGRQRLVRNEDAAEQAYPQ
jgi:hypothetical protein